jgi:antirestriction protein ArdC
MNTANQPIDVYAIVTNRIIAQLEQGTIPWRKPWTEGGHPQNLITKTLYRGINIWMLSSYGYAQNYFLTFKQLKALGGSVQKGEKAQLVVFWKKSEEQQETTDEDQKPAKAILRYYYVFNIAQCDNLPEILTIPFDQQLPFSSITVCDEIIEHMPICPSIKHGKTKAFYDPLKDFISVPKPGIFDNAESYYDTLYHELIHATGHQSRLNRKEVVEHDKFGSEQYSIEELTAEIGACYLNSISGISEKVFDNNVAYINGWLTALRNNKRLIVYASSQAQRATDFILNIPSKQLTEEAPAEQLETP